MSNIHITLSPREGLPPLTLGRQGDTLTVNGEPFDFSGVPEGAVLPADAIDSPYFSGPVTRTDGDLNLTMRLPHGAAAPHETRFPEPITVTGDGPVVLPPYEMETSDAQD